MNVKNGQFGKFLKTWSLPVLPDRLDLIRQKLLNNAKYDQFDEVYENLKLAVKKCYQIGQF